MKNTQRVSLIGCMYLLAMTSSTYATTIPDNLADHSFLGQFETVSELSGEFDLSSLASNYNQLKVTFSFIDDTSSFADDAMPWDIGSSDNSLDITPYHIADESINYSRGYIGFEEVTFRYQDIRETAEITIDNILTTGVRVYSDFKSDFRQLLHVHYEAGHDWLPQYWGCNGECDVYELSHYISSEGYTGNFEFVYYIAPNELASAVVNNKLSFTIKALSGDYYLASATIEVL